MLPVANCRAGGDVGPVGVCAGRSETSGMGLGQALLHMQDATLNTDSCSAQNV